MIFTITLNPAVDHTLVLEDFAPGKANRVLESRSDPGGKGVNVSRVLRELGDDSIATGFVGGGLGRFIEHRLGNLGIHSEFIHTRGETRTNVTIFDKRHHTLTAIHDKGPTTNPWYLDELYNRLESEVKPGDWVMVGGSIPPPITPQVYHDLILRMKKLGAYTVLDADGEALRAGLEAIPYLAKPNRFELGQALRKDLSNEAALLRAAEQLHDRGVAVVIVTASEQGAYGLNDQGAWRAVPPMVEKVSGVGAGDAFLAGVLHVLCAAGSLEDALRQGTAAASAAVQNPGTELCHRREIERLVGRVVIFPVERSPKGRAHALPVKGP
ncbi:MAG: 1-phosphofructokinase [Chloroflexi bacterium]|nr:1-phosphofructokinase [Chloroflexota bacterium]